MSFPLKEGLRQRRMNSIILMPTKVEMSFPLKEGLRLLTFLKN